MRSAPSFSLSRRWKVLFWTWALLVLTFVVLVGWPTLYRYDRFEQTMTAPRVLMKTHRITGEITILSPDPPDAGQGRPGALSVEGRLAQNR